MIYHYFLKDFFIDRWNYLVDRDKEKGITRVMGVESAKNFIDQFIKEFPNISKNYIFDTRCFNGVLEFTFEKSNKIENGDFNDRA